MIYTTLVRYKSVPVGGCMRSGHPAGSSCQGPNLPLSPQFAPRRSTDGGVISGWREPPLPTEFAALVPHWRRERWTTPDEDFIDVDYLLSTGAALAEPSTHKKTPIVVMFHGLEGSRHSHYAYALAHACSARGWGLVRVVR